METTSERIMKDRGLRKNESHNEKMLESIMGLMPYDFVISYIVKHWTNEDIMYIMKERFGND